MKYATNLMPLFISNIQNKILLMNLQTLGLRGIDTINVDQMNSFYRVLEKKQHKIKNYDYNNYVGK